MQLNYGIVQSSPAKRFVFPAGEQHIKYDGLLTGNQIAIVKGADANDYLALSMWSQVVRDYGGSPRAIIPYLPAARADKSSLGVPLGAATYADLINRANLDEVACLDPHSMIMPHLIHRVTIVSATSLVHSAFRDMDDLVGVIAPDKGAIARSSEVAEGLGVPLFRAEKHRDPNTGNLSGFSCEPLPETGILLVADDICDRGGTFKGLATAIGIGRERLALWVTHGVFSSGADNLKDFYGTIATTDSFPAVGPNPSNFIVATTDYLIGKLHV